jgi:hypothetical protein
MCPYWRTIYPKTVYHFTALYSQLINDCTVPLLSFLFLYTLCACWTLSILPPTPWDFKTLFSGMNVHKLSAFNMFLLWVAPAVQCSNLYCYILHWFSSDILLLQSVSAYFVMTRKQYRCDNKQNCINCLASKLSHSQYEVCSFKCWKPPTDFPNNMQINGSQSNSNNLHSTWCSMKKLRSDYIWRMCATIWFRNTYLPFYT